MRWKLRDTQLEVSLSVGNMHSVHYGEVKAGQISVWSKIFCGNERVC